MTINIDDLTIGEAKKLANLFSSTPTQESGLNSFVGKKVIIRTYSAGVFFGEIVEKSGNEVILKNARRLYYWKTNNDGISLSEVANSGLDDCSKVCQATSLHWLEAIEIIICSQESIKSIESKNDYKA